MVAIVSGSVSRPMRYSLEYVVSCEEVVGIGVWWLPATISQAEGSGLVLM